MINPMALLKLKGLREQFKSSHPKLAPFMNRVYPDAIAEGTVVDIKVTDPNGNSYHYNMRITAEDMAAINEVREAAGFGAAEEN
ncbi:MAG: hypothetical protein Q4A32_05120 [Lachnospiraceae bacterium]|nr:hypothetical protein [Lachnospiraceae bacterium]